MFELSTDLTCIAPLYVGSLVVLGSNSWHACLDHWATTALMWCGSSENGEPAQISSSFVVPNCVVPSPNPLVAFQWTNAHSLPQI
ncbi:hypothetical protein TNCV_1089431 [Trichonephila clavipes]|uniref:Uncharacterized protein n=1 Tax=Trichonephila clavipes TaxID=2585209 RepID=A0A8X6VFY4_TRICX|nr:hypothetical protein TNCV_1089431 [Trichonephila clavipes]